MKVILRFTFTSKRSTLNGEVTSLLMLASPLQGARFFGKTLVRFRRNRLKSMAVNLQGAVELSEVVEAFRVLKKRGGKRSVSELNRFAFYDPKYLNNLGRYLRSISPVEYYSGLKWFELSPYTGLSIKKSSGKSRPLLIPHPKDRVVYSVAFIKTRNLIRDVLVKERALGLGITAKEESVESKQILYEIYGELSSGRQKWVLKLDYKDFFSSIDREIALRRLSKFFKGVNQRRIYRLIKKSIWNAIQAKPEFWGGFGHLDLRKKGIPQGLSYSPLLASFYALPLDSIARRIGGCRSYRYLDDMIILAPSKEKAMKVYELIKKRSEKLKLKLHPLRPGSKTQLIEIDKENFEFLGIGISKTGLYIPDGSIENFFDKFSKEIVNASTSREQSFSRIVEIFGLFSSGWVNFYKTICPLDFPRVENILNDKIEKYLKKHKTRRTVGQMFRNTTLLIDRPYFR